MRGRRKQMKVNLFGRLPLIIIPLLCLGIAASAQDVIFVDADASGSADGSSWQDAYKHVQDALAAAESNGNIDEIWVASGIYYPDRSSSNPQGTGARDASFHLIDALAVRGGFVGNENPSTFNLANRNIQGQQTILSGDLSGNDGADFANYSENSYHVVTGSAANNTAVMDGFFIQSGSGYGGDYCVDRYGGGIYNDAGSPVILNCTFRANRAAGGGGAMANFFLSNPLLSYCVFTENEGGDFGGAIYNLDSHPHFASCEFSYNVPGEYGVGGVLANYRSSPVVTDSEFSHNSGSAVYCTANPDMYYYECSSDPGYARVAAPEFTRCIFINNEAEYGGAALLCTYNSNPVITNCFFLGNIAQGPYSAGGAIFSNSSPRIINSVFSGNSSTPKGGAISFNGGSPVITNCSFSGNSVTSGNGGAIYSSSATTAIISNSIFWDDTPDELYCENISNCQLSYSDIEGGWSGSGAGNISSNPLFTDAEGLDNQPGTEDDDLRPSAGSTVIDSGSNALLGPDSADLDDDSDTSETTPLDLDDHPRISNGSVDMGAYEAVGGTISLVLNTDELYVHEGSQASFTAALSSEPGESVQVEVAWQSGDSDIVVLYPDDGVLTFTSSAAQTVTLYANEDFDFLSGQAVIELSIPGVMSRTLTAIEIDNDEPASICYVDYQATGLNDGSSWADAFTDLQNGLALAASAPEVKEIRVAQGTYRPAGYNGDRGSTFELSDGVILRGGYSGPAGQWNPQLYPVILSGDLNSNDTLSFGNYTENSYHVVTVGGCGTGTVLEGFTVAGGNSDYGEGAGISITGGSPELRQCRIIRNKSLGMAGGVINAGADTLFMDCVFDNNRGDTGAGVLSSGPATPRFFNCVFSSNDGEALMNITNSNAALTNCVFYGNSAGSGAAIYNTGNTTILTNCAFYDNQATYGGGGAIYNYQGAMGVYNCTFTNNQAAGIYYGRGGGAMYMYNGYAILINSVIWGNTDPADAQVQLDYGSLAEVLYSDIQGGQAEIVLDYYSDVYWYSGNLNINPGFTSDGHLQSGSPCIDAGDNFLGGSSAQPNMQYIVGVDADKNIRRVDDPFTADSGNPQAAAPIIDMGAYEFGAGPIPARLYVDEGAAGAGNGISWNDAFVDLSLALGTALTSGGEVSEIWVAAGVYTPVPSGDSRYLSFQLQNNLAVYGGFSGYEISPDQRDIANNPTVLSGDINGNDSGYYNNAENSYHVVNGSNVNTTAIFDGFIISGGNADGADSLGLGGGVYIENGSPTIRNCLIEGNSSAGAGAGLYCQGDLVIDNVTVGQNNDGSGAGAILSECRMTLEGELATTSGDLSLVSCEVNGTGNLAMSAGAMIAASGQENNPATVIRCDINGVGTLLIQAGWELLVEGNAIIDLAGTSGPNGTIQCDGLLHGRGDAQFRNATINVTRAVFEENSTILYSSIDATVAAPFGQFYIEDSVTVQDNVIDADGDHYMNLDPRFFSGLMSDNQIHVTISEGKNKQQGGLFELRGLDNLFDIYDPGQCTCQENGFFCAVNTQLYSLPVCDQTSWTLESLVVEDDAKVNLTNRFDFQEPFDSGGEDEVLYVRYLELGENAVLNTAFNRIYYETASITPTAKVINVPLLGFSLKNIAMDDAAEFALRVLSNNAAGMARVERDTSSALDPAGVMVMENYVQGNPDLNARAQGWFASVSPQEEQVIILFEYLWDTNTSGSQLVIYLTDSPTMLSRNDPLRSAHYAEVGRLYPPPTARPGAYGSERFGIYQKWVPTGDLDFVRGLRMEFELVGPAGTSLLINNWDPQVWCTTYCGDVTGDYGATILDYLTLMGEFGGSSAPFPDDNRSLVCLDGVFSEDGYLNSNDLLSWDWMINHDGLIGSLCKVPLLSSAGAGSSSVPVSSGPTPCMSNSDTLNGSLVIAGKRRASLDSTKRKDRLYGFDSSGRLLDYYDYADVGYGRLLTDSTGELYQLHFDRGLIRFSDQQEIVPAGNLAGFTEPRYNSPADIYIGLQVDGGNEVAGLPILDAAFDDAGDLYVLPVVVKPALGEAYAAAAKLQINPDASPPYELMNIYDDPQDPNDNDARFLSEIEVDAEGTVYVLNSHHLNESDIVWAFDAADGNLLDKVFLRRPDSHQMPVCGPEAMLASRWDSRLYLASSQNDTEAGQCSIYALATNQIGMPLERKITINNMGHVTAIAEDSNTGTLFAAGMQMWDIPDANTVIGVDAEPFYHAVIAVLPQNVSDTADAWLYDPNEICGVGSVCTAGWDTAICQSNDLALPVSIVWRGGSGHDSDLDHCGTVTLEDLAIMADNWQAYDCVFPDWCRQADIDRSGTVNLDDLILLAQYWLQGNPL